MATYTDVEKTEINNSNVIFVDKTILKINEVSGILNFNQIKVSGVNRTSELISLCPVSNETTSVPSFVHYWR